MVEAEALFEVKDEFEVSVDLGLELEVEFEIKDESEREFSSDCLDWFEVEERRELFEFPE